MKDEGNHQGAVDNSFSEQRIRIVHVNYILCEKIGPAHVAEPGLTAGKQVAVGRRNTGEWKFLTNTVHRKIRLFALFNQGTTSLQ